MKIFFSFLLLLTLFTFPAFAGRHSEPVQHHQAVHQYHQEYRGHYEARPYYHADRSFDHAYWGTHFGVAHPFFWYHCRWFGPRFSVGSRFYYGGVWFVIVDPVPEIWLDDGAVYVDYVNGVYYLVSPVHPGLRIAVTVGF